MGYSVEVTELKKKPKQILFKKSKSSIDVDKDLPRLLEKLTQSFTNEDVEKGVLERLKSLSLDSLNSLFWVS